MLYDDDRDYYDSENIDELYDHDDSLEVSEDPEWITSCRQASCRPSQAPLRGPQAPRHPC